MFIGNNYPLAISLAFSLLPRLAVGRLSRILHGCGRLWLWPHGCGAGRLAKSTAMQTSNVECQWLIRMMRQEMCGTYPFHKPEHCMHRALLNQDLSLKQIIQFERKGKERIRNKI